MWINLLKTTQPAADFNFMAVYGGTQDQAKVILTSVKKRYPSANIRKMRVILDFADE